MDTATPEGRSAEEQRLFVAVPLPEEVLSTVRCAQEALPSVSGLRLLRTEQLHVTLAFIGQANEGKARAAKEVIGGLSSNLGGEGVLGGFLFLPSVRRARVVALAIDDAGGDFAAVFERVMCGLEAAEVMKREKRPFRPHLTIARLRNPGLVEPKSECAEVAYRIGSVCLYRSELKPEGAQYTVLCRKIMAADG